MYDCSVLNVSVSFGDSEMVPFWSIETPHVALYSGNIANKQGIEIVLDAAVVLADRSDLTFVICGQGPNRAMLEERLSPLFSDVFPFDGQRCVDMAGRVVERLRAQGVLA